MARFGLSGKIRCLPLLGQAIIFFVVGVSFHARAGQQAEPRLKTPPEPTLLASASPQLPRTTLPPTQIPNTGHEITPKQQRDLLKHKFEKMKRDAEELAELAKSLQEDLEASNENILSLEVVEKAKKIEKLSKKIKNAAKGY